MSCDTAIAKQLSIRRQEPRRKQMTAPRCSYRFQWIVISPELDKKQTVTNPTNACPYTWRCKSKTIEGGIQYYTNVLRRGFADRQSRPERWGTFQLNQLQENWYRRPTKTASELTRQRAAELLAQPKLALGCKSSASYKNAYLLYQHICMTRNVMNRRQVPQISHPSHECPYTRSQLMHNN